MAYAEDEGGPPKPWPNVRSTFEHLTKKLEEVDPGRRAEVIEYWERQLSREKSGVRSSPEAEQLEGPPKPWPNVRSTFEHLTKKLEEVDPGRRAEVIEYWERQLSRAKSGGKTRTISAPSRRRARRKRRTGGRSSRKR